MIEFRDVWKSFKNVDAVRGVSFTIRDREIFGLLGPNGAGKTTLILTMASVYRATRGDVLIDGVSVREQPERVKEMIGISFQDPKYDRILSARDILDWHGKVTGVKKKEREIRINDILDKFGLREEADKRTWMLSGGTKKKIENAKVFVQKPRIAVFDEPTAYLDVPSRLKVWEMIGELRDEGSTILLATNMMDEADRMSDRVGIMSRGEMVNVGTPEELKGSLMGQDIIELRLANDPLPFVEELKQIAEVKNVVVDGRRMTIYLSNGRILLPYVINKLNSKGGEVESVGLKEPTLEDVFLHYTGTELA